MKFRVNKKGTIVEMQEKDIYIILTREDIDLIIKELNNAKEKSKKASDNKNS